MAEVRERLRVSDAERHGAATWLGTAFADGRLDVVEYESRVDRAYSAVTYGDLDQLFTDLPRPAAVLPSRPQYPPYPAHLAPPSRTTSSTDSPTNSATRRRCSPRADLATREEQIAVAEVLYASRGLSPWACGYRG